VIWFYERRGTYVRCETREGTDGAAPLELVILKDGVEVIERFADSRLMLQRQHEFEQALQNDGWQGPFGRVI
jgi:hypothetical protein